MNATVAVVGGDGCDGSDGGEGSSAAPPSAAPSAAAAPSRLRGGAAAADGHSAGARAQDGRRAPPRLALGGAVQLRPVPSSATEARRSAALPALPEPWRAHCRPYPLRLGVWGVHNACGRPTSVALARRTGALCVAKATDPCTPCNGAIPKRHGGRLARPPAGAAAARVAAVAEPAAAVECNGACRAVAAARCRAGLEGAGCSALPSRRRGAAGASADQKAAGWSLGQVGRGGQRLARLAGCSGGRGSGGACDVPRVVASARLARLAGCSWLEGRGGRGGGCACDIPRAVAPAWLARLARCT